MTLFQKPRCIWPDPYPITAYFLSINKRLSAASSAVELHMDSHLAGVEDEDLRAAAAGHLVLLVALLPGWTAAFSSLFCWVLISGCCLLLPSTQLQACAIARQRHSMQSCTLAGGAARRVWRRSCSTLWVRLGGSVELVILVR
jgi:hypothetical protein